ncbi:hypothetical protein [Streptomyces capitiformicae]|uniref:Uncharacterized protein n=1 Tax=Streptomyces capitiformicae TaxID=2014920 RepID=A0A919GFN3_9ACTN|nr:hypothetical protein [Streptomyces capitiformicae]GHH83466.1 hypothetical protein GCM10017771_10120 [Streptomyces capitiformicae]
MNDWWTQLDDRTRQEADAHVLDDRHLLAVKIVWEALRPLGLDLCEAQKIVHTRYEALVDRVRHTPPDPLDVPSLTARAAAHPGRVAAIEALWDGDTVHGWFVDLVAVLEDPEGEARLATVHHRPEGPSPATAATEAGQALADHLGVPFHFASPAVPDDEAPRWRTGQRPSEDA